MNPPPEPRPLPEGLPPLPPLPAGYTEWVYRGLGWKSSVSTTYACAASTQEKWCVVEDAYPVGPINLHYIEALPAPSVLPRVGTPLTPPTKKAIELCAKEIYDAWEGMEGWVSWSPGGNSQMQDSARRLAAERMGADFAPWSIRGADTVPSPTPGKTEGVTPIADAAFDYLLDGVQAFFRGKFENDDLLDRVAYSRGCVREVETELAQLRAIFPEICKAIGNGAFCSPTSSVEFLREIPKEIEMVVAQLRAENERLRALAKDAVEVVQGAENRLRRIGFDDDSFEQMMENVILSARRTLPAPPDVEGA